MLAGGELGLRRSGRKVREATRYAADHAISIAVMGCRVNGPGETDMTDLGLWCGPKYVNLKRGEATLGSFTYDEILPRLKQELDTLIAAKKGLSRVASGAAKTHQKEP